MANAGDEVTKHPEHVHGLREVGGGGRVHAPEKRARCILDRVCVRHALGKLCCATIVLE